MSDNENDDDYTYHPEEVENAEKEGRPILISRLFRSDHLKHDIPIGSIVEVEIAIEDENKHCGTVVNLKGLCRLVVVEHTRGCDGTPLYSVCDLPVTPPKGNIFSPPMMAYKAITTIYKFGLGKNSLKVVGNPVKLYPDLYTWMHD